MKYFPIVITPFLVTETLDLLRKAGERHLESVVLWLGRRTEDRISVTEPYVPAHTADCDYFRIPSHAISDLLSHLTTTGTFVAAQVHTHPKEAFHSRPDDKWAIVRHEGALSLVVPYFARKTEANNFLDRIAAFRLNSGNIWEELSPQDRESLIQIT